MATNWRSPLERIPHDPPPPTTLPLYGNFHPHQKCPPRIHCRSLGRLLSLLESRVLRQIHRPTSRFEMRNRRRRPTPRRRLRPRSLAQCQSRCRSTPRLRQNHPQKFPRRDPHFISLPRIPRPHRKISRSIPQHHLSPQSPRHPAPRRSRPHQSPRRQTIQITQKNFRSTTPIAISTRIPTALCRSTTSTFQPVVRILPPLRRRKRGPRLDLSRLPPPHR